MKINEQIIGILILVLVFLLYTSYSLKLNNVLLQFVLSTSLTFTTNITQCFFTLKEHSNDDSTESMLQSKWRM